jgi:hypothetical protein
VDWRRKVAVLLRDDLEGCGCRMEDLHGIKKKNSILSEVEGRDSFAGDQGMKRFPAQPHLFWKHIDGDFHVSPPSNEVQNGK